MKKSIFMALTLLMAVAMQAQTISFTASEWAAVKSLQNGDALTDYTKDGVTVTFAQGTGTSAPSYNAQYSAVAAVSGNSMTIVIPEGKQLNQAEFTMYSATMATNLTNAAWSGGTAANQGATVTWTGTEESLTVTFSATEGFVAFSVTFSEPPLDPSLSYNDTTVLDIPAYVAQWQEANPWDEWPTGPADSIGFAVDDKLIIFKKGLEGDQPSYQDNSVYLSWMSTLTVTAPYKIRKIILTFAGHRVAENWLKMGNPKSSCSTGQLELGEIDWERNISTAIWTGDAAQVVFTSGYGSPLAGVTIISDTTDNRAMVTFYDFNGNIAKTEPVSIGGNATAPIIDDECFGGWDQEFTDVLADLEVHPVHRTLLNFSIDEWKEQYGTWRIPQATKGDYTIFSDYYEGGGIGEDPIVIDGVRYQNRLLIYSGYQYIKAAEPFNNLTILCRYESNAANLAAATWSSGVVEQDGLYVHWTGYTDSLRWDMPDASYQICAYRIECRQLTEYTVIFYNIHGEEIQRETVARGGNATAPADMTETGYQFIGWDTSLTNLGGDNPFIEVHPVYEEVAGYVTVTFVDIDGNLIQRRRVAIGGTVSAPQAPDVPFMLFAGWSHDLTNITDDVTIKAVYTIDWNNPDILTMEQFRTISPQEGQYYVVKGIMTRYQWESPDLEDGGTLSFAISDSATAISTELNVIHSTGLNGAPFFHKAQVQSGDTLIVYGQYGVTRLGQGNYLGLANGYLLYQGMPTDRSNIVYLEMPDAQALYDFNGDGKKQVASLSVKNYIVDEQVPGCQCTHDNQDITITATASIADGFAPQDTIIRHTFENIGALGYSSGNRILSIEDLNRDGKPEFTIGNVTFTERSEGSVTGSTQVWISKEKEYTLANGAFTMTNMDLNNDGRLDYLIITNTNPSPYGQIAYQIQDGGFRFETMEFVNSTPLHAPHVRKAKSVANQLSLPMTTIDLNGDGLMDLVNERDGFLYINKGNGQWEWKDMDETIVLTDLNGDGLTDFVMPGDDALKVAIYDAASQNYAITSINSTAVIDDTPFCYDFDKDGDIDILATFSAYNNQNVAYTSFFINDGNGNFTKQNEQNYGSNNKLWFSECQDIDGDGYYDLLAFRAEILIYSYSIPFVGTSNTMYFAPGAEVVLLRGGANNTFAAPQKLYELSCATTLWRNFDSASYRRNSMSIHVNAEDLDGSGTTRVWVSGFADPPITASNHNNGTTELYPFPVASPNNRPTAPAAPQLAYQNGLLTVTWGNGADEKTAVADLTYALRIGTTAGGNDILAAHAKADGNRRNFLDGNMGRAHSYTIDLRSYAPSDIYVAVQAIDAQHMGSAWSEEASVSHIFVPIDFVLSKDKIAFGDSVEVHYTSLPEGYAHSWHYADGELLQDDSFLVLRFPTGGEKTITHIVTFPDGQKDSVSAVLTILPAKAGAPVDITNGDPYNYDISNLLKNPLADYTYDGRQDGVRNLVYEGVQDSTFFRQSLGMWNSEIQSIQAMRWYDYNRNGDVDLLLRTSGSNVEYMLHDANLPALTSRVNTAFSANNNLVYLLDFVPICYTLNEDLRHIGFPECFYGTEIGNTGYYSAQIADFTKDGSVTFKDIIVNGDATLLRNMLGYKDLCSLQTADFDHDGFADIAALGNAMEQTDYPYLVLFYNRGKGIYEQSNIPFPEALPAGGTNAIMEDFNGDGYTDVLVYHNDQWDPNDVKFGRVYWNNNNTTFIRMDLPKSANIVVPENKPFVITDVDNNGYKDAVAVITEPAADAYALYIWYMGAEGLMNHGVLVEGIKDVWDLQDVYLTPNEHYLKFNLTTLYPIVTQPDTRPAAPTNIQASMTNEGLLLTWDDAMDDHTPAALMRYNLSVKAEGATTYLFSPQNGGNENAAYLPGYNYINATRFLIPTSVLTNGNYEVRLQAVDNQNKMSLFSETLVYHVVRNPIEAPSKTCAWDNTSISYQGAEEADTPVWNFGTDAVVNSGSEFGPYTIYWQSGGEKTISLTLTDTTYTVTIMVSDPYELPIYPPQELYEDVPFTVDLPEGVTCAWKARLNDDTEWHKVDGTGILLDASYILNYDRRLRVNGATITAYLLPNEISLCNDKLELRFEFTTPEGCTGIYEYVVTVRPQTNIPTLSLVTTDANGHNALSWTNVDAFQTINVYKEGTTFDDFQLIGSANASVSSFTDANSDATQKAERYRITGISANGSESPASAIHKTVHLTISRGIVDGTFNLIWNAYEGASIASYNILRGATPASLAQIATVAASNTSYTDQTPDDNLPYYAIEYILPAAANVPAVNPNRAPAANLAGRSNVVDRRNAEQGLENVQSGNVQYTKVLIDGTIFILRGEKVYTITGQETIVP